MMPQNFLSRGLFTKSFCPLNLERTFQSSDFVSGDATPFHVYNIITSNCFCSSSDGAVLCCICKTSTRYWVLQSFTAARLRDLAHPPSRPFPCVHANSFCSVQRADCRRRRKEAEKESVAQAGLGLRREFRHAHRKTLLARTRIQRFLTFCCD